MLTFIYFVNFFKSIIVADWEHISGIYPFLQNEYSEQWALACGEILRILTHYNRPICKTELPNSEADRSNSSSQATTSESADGESSFHIPSVRQERKPLRPLSPWITDILLAAPLGIRSDYFRWWAVSIIAKYFSFLDLFETSIGLYKDRSGFNGWIFQYLCSSKPYRMLLTSRNKHVGRPHLLINCHFAGRYMHMDAYMLRMPFPTGYLE